MRDPARRARFRPLFQVAAIGILTHPLLDYLNDYGIRPWLPFSDRRHYGDLLSIVDPWLWIIFGIALYMLTVSRLGRMAWMALGGLMGVLIFLAAGARPGLLWLLGVALGFVAGYFLRRHGYHPARAALLIFVAYLAGIAIVHGSVLRSAVAMAPGLSHEPVLTVSALPGRPGAAHRWTIVVETTSRYFIADVRDLEADSRPDFEVFEKNLEDSCFKASLTDGQMAALARFARFPSVTSRVANGSCTTFLRDLRYARRALSGWGVASTTVPIRAAD
jgi:inner membrane protein